MAKCKCEQIKEMLDKVADKIKQMQSVDGDEKNPINADLLRTIKAATYERIEEIVRGK